MSKIVETIHHGGYRSSRTLHIHPVNVADIAKWLGGCPYLSPFATFEAEGIAGRLCSIAASVGGGKGSLDRGWVHWEVS